MASRLSSMPAGAGLFSGSRIWSANCFCSAASASGGVGIPDRCVLIACLHPIDGMDLFHQFFDGWKIEIAFQQRGHGPQSAVCRIEEFPDRVDHIGTVGVDDQVLGFVVVPGDVDIGHPFGRQPFEELHGVVAVIDAVDVDVVDVQQQVAVGAFEHRVDEFQLAQLVAGRCVIRDVFPGNSPSDKILGLANASGHPVHRFPGKGNRHQVVQMSMLRTVTEMLGINLDVVLVEKSARAAQEGLVQRFGRAQRKGKPVADERLALGPLPELPAANATDADPVLRGDFHEAQWRQVGLLKRAQEGPPETESRARDRESRESCGTHYLRSLCEKDQATPQEPSPQLPSPHEPSLSSPSPQLPSPQEPSESSPSPQLPSPQEPSESSPLSLSSPHEPSPQDPSLSSSPMPRFCDSEPASRSSAWNGLAVWSAAMAAVANDAPATAPIAVTSCVFLSISIASNSIDNLFIGPRDPFPARGKRACPIGPGGELISFAHPATRA